MAWNTYAQTDFTGGENIKILPDLIKENQLLSAENCVITPDGVLRTRQGKTKINTVSMGSGPVLSVFRFCKESGAKYIVAQHGTTLYAATWDGVSSITSLTSVKTGLAPTVKLRGVVWRNVLILTNGIDNPFYFNGTTCADLGGSPPKSKVLTVYAGKLWFVDETNPNWLRFSGLEDYDSWDALDVINIRTGDGDKIVALSAQSGGLVIFKQNSIWTLYGQSKADISVTTSPISAHIGAVGADSVLDDGIFVGMDNLYTFNLTSISPFPETHTALLQTLSISELTRITMAADIAKKYAVISLHNTDDHTLCVHGKFQGATTTWRNLKINCMCALNGVGDNGGIVFGDTTNGWLYLYSGTSDDGTVITTKIKTRYQDILSSKEKVWRKFCADVNLLDTTNRVQRLDFTYDLYYQSSTTSTTITVTSMGGTGLIWGTDAWGSKPWGANETIKTRVSPKMWMNNQRSRYISFEISSTHPIELVSYYTKYREVGTTL